MKKRIWQTVSVITGIILICMLFAGCTAAAEKDAEQEKVPAKDITKTLQHEEVERTYHIHLPPGFTKEKKYPLVIGLHGGGGQAKNYKDDSTQSSLWKGTDKRNMVLVLPEGLNRQWCDGRKEPLKTEKEYDDVGFISKIIEIMVKEYSIDPERVYSTGISNGGFMSIRLAMDLSDKLAAVAPVTAQISWAIKDKSPKHPISVMIINGTADPLVPYYGGHVRIFKIGKSRGRILSTARTVGIFRRHNRCKLIPEKKVIPDIDPEDGAKAEIHTYKQGKEETEVILIKVIGGGHTWPGGIQYLKPKIIGVVCRDFNATDMILDFFIRHSRKKPAE